MPKPSLAVGPSRWWSLLVVIGIIALLISHFTPGIEQGASHRRSQDGVPFKPEADFNWQCLSMPVIYKGITPRTRSYRLFSIRAYHQCHKPGAPVHCVVLPWSPMDRSDFGNGTTITLDSCNFPTVRSASNDIWVESQAAGTYLVLPGLRQHSITQCNLGLAGMLRRSHTARLGLPN